LVWVWGVGRWEMREDEEEKTIFVYVRGNSIDEHKPNFRRASSRHN